MVLLLLPVNDHRVMVWTALMATQAMVVGAFMAGGDGMMHGEGSRRYLYSLSNMASSIGRSTVHGTRDNA